MADVEGAPFHRPMLPYNQEPTATLQAGNTIIHSFLSPSDRNLDAPTVAAFGEEWSKFDRFSEEDIRVAGSQYFDLVDDTMLHPGSIVLDAGCGTGRWSVYAAGRAGFIEAIDPSLAVYAAARFTQQAGNIRVTQASIDNIPFADGSFDFVCCLGVLHHIPDPGRALRKLVAQLKPGGHVLLYLYYSLDNRGLAYRLLFRLSNLLRLVVSSLPHGVKQVVCDLLAVLLYVPFVWLATLARRVAPGRQWHERMPLAYYVDKTFTIIRNDALDRFGTPLEQRFSRQEIETMMRQAGLSGIRFSEFQPYWHATGRKP
jgi:SAM-dependent methyltransferase